jgi:hypothetical protein
MTKSKNVFLHSSALLIFGGSAICHGADTAVQNPTPNNGRAESIGRTAGEVAGAIIGTVIGEARGSRSAAAGSVVGEKIGGNLGAGAGQVLDQHAAENQRTGRGGPDDPRYNPASIFDR